MRKSAVLGETKPDGSLMRIVAVGVFVPLLWATGCATQLGSIFGSAVATPDAGMVHDENASKTLFDLGTCFPRAVQVRGRIRRESILGVVVAARPAIVECLVDPKNRGPDKSTKVNIDVVVTESTVENKVTGDNLTSAGQACIKAVLNNSHAFDQAEREETSVHSHAEFNHLANVHPAVPFGTSEGAEIAGEIRLAEKNWCSCFEPWKTSPPRTLKSQLLIAKDKAGRLLTRAEFEKVKDSTIEGIERCLAAKIAALNLPIKSDELNIPYALYFIHSELDRGFDDAPPEVNYAQWRALRGQRAATVALRLADRVNAVLDYDDIASEYQRKPDPSLVPQLRNGCQTLLAADTAWADALGQQLDADKHALAIARQLTDAPVAPGDLDALQRQLGLSQSDFETAVKTKAADATACRF